MRAYLLATTATMALLAATSSTHAQTNWTGAVSTDWFTAGNWTAGVPTAITNANIDTASTPTVVVAHTPSGTVQNLAVGSNGTGNLTIQDGGKVISVLGLGAVGNLPGSQGVVTVTGVGSQWANADLVVGGLGTGTLIITNSGR